MGHWVRHGITYGIPADPGGFLTGERLCIFGACTTPCPTPGKSVARWRLSMDNPYLEVVSLVERLHRQFLEVVKLELEGFGIHDINHVQAMMFFNIGDAEMTVELAIAPLAFSNPDDDEGAPTSAMWSSFLRSR
jgi:hypothetical protein